MPNDVSSTARLLARARADDAAAREELYARYLPRLRRWTAGRLPSIARDLVDTHDVIQETLFQSVQRLHAFEMRGEGAFLAYLQRAVRNRIRNELRRVVRKPVPGALGDDHAAAGPSPLDVALGAQTRARYKESLRQLSRSDRLAIIARIERACSYAEVAKVLGKENGAAARKALERALGRLAAGMGHQR